MDSRKYLAEDEIYELLNRSESDIGVSDLESEHNDCDKNSDSEVSVTPNIQHVSNIFLQNIVKDNCNDLCALYLIQILILGAKFMTNNSYQRLRKRLVLSSQLTTHHLLSTTLMSLYKTIFKKTKEGKISVCISFY